MDFIHYNLFSFIKYTVSVLGREEGYMVKYTPSRSEPEGTPEGKEVYLAFYFK